MDERFLLLFFKKEALCLHFYLLPTWAVTKKENTSRPDEHPGLIPQVASASPAEAPDPAAPAGPPPPPRRSPAPARSPPGRAPLPRTPDTAPPSCRRS